MSVKSDAESMQELTSLMWNRYLRERVREELNHEMNAYKAEVVTNHGDGTLTVQRPFESVTLRLKAASSLEYAQPGDMVLVVGIGDKSKALSNAFILCKTDLSDNAHVAVSGFGNNLLDNWYFVGGGTGDGVFPVNQRRQTQYTGSGLKFDRWGFGPDGGSLNLLSGGAQVSVTSSGQTFMQNIGTDPSYLLGKTVTVSLLTASGSLYVSTGTLPSSLPNATTTYISQAIPSVGNLAVIYDTGSDHFASGVANSASSSASITIAAVKLELGKRQTLAHQENGTWVLNEIPDYSTELAKCQRYLFVLTPQSNPYGFSGFGSGHASAGGAVVIISTPVTMRNASPTVTYSGSWALINRAGPTTISMTGVSYPRLSTNAISFIARGSGVTAGALYEFTANNDSSAKLIVSCEI